MNNEEKENKICPICSHEYENITKTFVCNHTYCQTCLVTWYRNCVSNGLQPSCPECRKSDDIWRG